MSKGASTTFKSNRLWTVTDGAERDIRLLDESEAKVREITEELAKCLEAFQVIGKPIQELVLEADGIVTGHGGNERNHVVFAEGNENATYSSCVRLH